MPLNVPLMFGKMNKQNVGLKSYESEHQYHDLYLMVLSLNDRNNC